MCFGVLFVFTFPGKWAEAGERAASCPALLASGDSKKGTTHASHDSFSLTERLIAYLSELMQEQVLSIERLQEWSVGLERGELVNPIAKSENEAKVRSDLLIHYEAMQEYVESGELDHAKLLAWTQKTLKQKTKDQENRDESQEETKIVFTKGKFNLIEPGEFDYGEVGETKRVKIKKAFELMQTHVTQWMWFKVMGDNPSEFKKKEHCPESYIQLPNAAGQSVGMCPDHPVEKVSALKDQAHPDYKYSVYAFIEKLHELSERDDPIIKEVFPDHKKGDRYRLPTEQEYEYVVKNRGKNNGTYFFGENESKLKKYGYYYQNSHDQTQPVAQLKPLMVDGDKPFWDIVGNVYVWTDSFMGSFRVIRGGGWSNCARDLRSAFRFSYGPGCSYDHVGFRLVRSKP